MSELAAIRTENLGKVFGRGRKSVEAVKNLTLEVHLGQVYGFLGPNGAGPALRPNPAWLSLAPCWRLGSSA